MRWRWLWVWHGADEKIESLGDGVAHFFEGGKGKCWHTFQIRGGNGEIYSLQNLKDEN